MYKEFELVAILIAFALAGSLFTELIFAVFA